MSRIGTIPIHKPQGVNIILEGQLIQITGPKGSIKRKIPEGIVLKDLGNEKIKIESEKSDKIGNMLYGTTRAHIANMIKGVSEGWKKNLELVGTGFRAETTGSILTLTVGYSHPIKVQAPEGLSFKVEKTDITIEGVDKDLVGQIAERIRNMRPPEPYKGKGIRYKDEYVRRKAGKAAKAQGAPA